LTTQKIEWQSKATKQGTCKICNQKIVEINEKYDVCINCWLGLDGDINKMSSTRIEKCCKICMKDFYQKPLKSDTEGFFSDESIGHDFRNYVVNICPTCKKTPIKDRQVQEGRCGRCGCEELKRVEYYTGTPRHKHLKKYTWQHLPEYWEEDKDSEQLDCDCMLTKEITYCPECLYKKEQNFK
jgi:hypothetical protein